MRVRLIEADQRRDVERFIRFPYALYRESPFWVPPLLDGQRRLLNKREHPFYRHSDADFFVAEEGPRVVGRIALLENRPFNAYHHSRTAQFGYLELVDDAAVAEALFDAVCQRARERGLNELCGPWVLVRTDGSGVLIKGFEHLPAMGIPYNPPYYDGLIQRQGLVKEYDALSGFLVQGHQLSERIWTIAERVKQKRGFSVATFADRREMRAWVPRMADLYRNAFARARGFAPLSDDELAIFAETIIAVADPRLIKLVLKGDEVVGFILAYPNVTRGLQRARGRLFPFGWYHLLRERRTTKHVDLNGVGLLPQYQGLGANALLYAELARSLIAFGAEYADVVQVSEDNYKSLSDMEALGVHWHKVHRHYQRSL